MSVVVYKRSIEVVIFDKDGVIINSEPQHKEFSREFYVKKGFSSFITKEMQETFVGRDARLIWRDILITCGYKEEQITPELINQFVKEEYDYKTMRFNESPVIPVKGIYELLDDLRSNGTLLAVASSSHLDNVISSLKKLGVKDYFNVLVGGNQVKKGKPEPDIFLKASKLYGIEPHKCVVIEDSANGVTAAKTGGMKCIGYANPDSGVQDLSLADYVVKEIPEIIVDKLLK